MTGKVTVIFPGFQGFPGAVGTLSPPCFCHHDPPHPTMNVNFLTHPAPPTMNVDFLTHSPWMWTSWPTPSHPMSPWCGFYNPPHHGCGLMTPETFLSITSLEFMGWIPFDRQNSNLAFADPGGTAGVCPPRVQILSFWHTNFLKRSHLGSWRPPTRSAPPLREILDPPLPSL